MEIVSGDQQSASAGYPLLGALVVRVLDAKGGALPGQAVGFRVTSGGGWLIDSVATTDNLGEAWNQWVLGKRTTDSQRVEAQVKGTASGAPISVVFRATAVPGSPTYLAFVVQPSDVIAGAPITPPVQVGVQDQWGNAIPDATILIYLRITPGTGAPGAALGGTLSATTANGVAVFPDLTVSAASTGYTLTAIRLGLISAVSAPFTVNPG